MGSFLLHLRLLNQNLVAALKMNLSSRKNISMFQWSQIILPLTYTIPIFNKTRGRHCFTPLPLHQRATPATLGGPYQTLMKLSKSSFLIYSFKDPRLHIVVFYKGLSLVGESTKGHYIIARHYLESLIAHILPLDS